MNTIRIVKFLPYRPELVWRALTERACVATWFMPTDDFAAEMGHAFQFRMPPQRGWDGQTFCQILELVPNRRLAYSYRGHATGEKPLQCAGLDSVGLREALRHATFDLDTVLRFTLTPHGEGTRLVLEHGPYRARMLFVRVIMAIGWRTRVLVRLERELARLAAL